MIIGNNEEWVLAEGFPKFNGSSSDETVQYSYSVPRSVYDADTPQYNELCDEPGYETWKLSGISISDKGEDQLDVTLTYKNPDTSGGASSTHEDGETQISMSSQPSESPIEYHPNYKAIWNHYLIYKPKEQTGEASGGYEFYSTATEPIEAAPTDYLTLKTPAIKNKKYWRFVKSQADAPESWIVHASPTKRAGLQAYVTPCPVITEKVFRTTYSSAVKTARGGDVGQWKTPSKTFGKSGAWLVMGVDICEEGKYWTVQTRYQFSATKDSDIYPVPTSATGNAL